MAYDIPEPCKFPYLGSSQMTLLCTHKKVEVALRPVVGLVFQEGDAEKFPQALCFESLDTFFQSQQAVFLFLMSCKCSIQTA